MPDRALDRALIIEAFRRLGDRLGARGVVGDIFVIGGAVMVLVYDARAATRDIDAVWQPRGIVQDEARAVAEELQLPPWWLNEQASSFIPRSPGWERVPAIDHPNLRVSAIAPEQLLAMKALAARQEDVADIRVLVGHLGLTTVDDVVATVEQVFPDQPLPERSRMVIEDVLASID